MSDPTAIALAAKAAFEASQLVSAEDRNVALRSIRDALSASKEAIFAANRADVESTGNKVARLDITKGDKWDSVLKGIDDIAGLPDPTGIVSYANELADGLQLFRVSCPIGVLLVIFEARPEVVVNIASLAIKSGNAAILKGGKESSRTTAVIAQTIADALSKTNLPLTYIQTVQSREDISSLLSLDQYIDLVIPRGSNALVRNIQQNTRIPVMGHADGICHLYLDESAQEKKAIPIIIDSKITYPTACNSLDTLVLHKSSLQTLWPSIAKALVAKNVQLLCDPPSLEAVTSSIETAKQATDGDFGFEFLDLRLAVKTVDSIEEAIAFINAHSSHHTDTIVTESDTSANKFCRAVDSAGTFVNASTRFADGFRYGFGAEVGISTGRIHARGPVGLDGLVIYKYMMKSTGPEGHITSAYGVGPGLEPFKHQQLSGISRLPF